MVITGVCYNKQNIYSEMQYFMGITAILKGLKHETVNTRKKKYVVKDLYHIQHVNSLNYINQWIKKNSRELC